MKKRVEQISLNQVFKLHRGSAPPHLSEPDITSDSAYDHVLECRRLNILVKSFSLITDVQWNSYPQQSSSDFRNPLLRHILASM